MTPEELEAAVLSGVKRMGEEGLSSLHSDVMGFLHAVDWAERWLLPLALFHLIVWSAVIGTRRSYEAQSCLLMGNYFDERGVFISTLYSAPLLCAAFFILVNSLRMAAGLLVEVKKLQVRKERQKKTATKAD
ncbi:MAG: hypothetical protein SGPRY_009258 [Prymnesium sp.]